MANSKAVAIRIPDELLAKIDDLAEKKYKSVKGKPNRSLVILDALISHFDTLSDTENNNHVVALSNSVTIQDLQELKDVVNKVINDLEQLKKINLTPSDSVIEVKTTDIEKKNSDQLELVQLISLPVSDSVINGLTNAQLAERFNCHQSTISGQKKIYRNNTSKFIEWTKGRDPDNYGWEPRYLDDKKGVRYYRVPETASLSEG